MSSGAPCTLAAPPLSSPCCAGRPPHRLGHLPCRPVCGVISVLLSFFVIARWLPRIRRGLFSSSKSKDKVDIKKVYKWEKKDLLGTGNFAEVYKATIIDGKDRPFKTAEDEGDNKTGKIPGKDQVAVKVIDKAKVEDMNDITREIEIMQQVTHPNIIQLYEVFEGGQKNVSLVMELVTGGELFDRIVEKGSYTEKDAAKCIYQLCDALNYLHAKKIVHRDLKPENLLYAKPDPDETIKVADFGLAREVAGGG